MWNFPNQLVLFPHDSGDLFKKVGHRLLGQSVKQCTAHFLTAGTHEGLAPEFLSWMRESTQKHSSSLKLACNQPKVMALMLGEAAEPRNQAQELAKTNPRRSILSLFPEKVEDQGSLLGSGPLVLYRTRAEVKTIINSP